MFKISKKKHLEIAIENIPNPPNPKIEFEQYSTPSIIASDVIWNAYSLGDIMDKSILDLGCGTGIFTIASLLLGAKNAIGVDIDQESIAIAKNTAKNMEITNFTFLINDIKDIEFVNDNFILKNSITDDIDINISDIDTIIQNPPFGSQSRLKKGSDRKFMEIAMEIASVVYSFHMAETEDFVSEYFKNLGGNITHRFFYKFPLSKIYEFHTKESKDIEVIVLRVENNKKFSKNSF